MKMKIKKLVDLIRWETKQERQRNRRPKDRSRKSGQLRSLDVEVRKLIPIGY